MSWILLIWLIAAELAEYLFSINRERIKGDMQIAVYYLLMAPLLLIRTVKGPLGALISRFALTQVLWITDWFRR